MYILIFFCILLVHGPSQNQKKTRRPYWIFSLFQATILPRILFSFSFLQAMRVFQPYFCLIFLFHWIIFFLLFIVWFYFTSEVCFRWYTILFLFFFYSKSYLTENQDRPFPTLEKRCIVTSNSQPNKQKKKEKRGTT